MKLPFSDIPFVPVYAVIRKNLFFLRCHVLKPNRYLSPPPPVVIAIIAILASILMPALSSARERSKTTGCHSNLKTLGNWNDIYMDNYGGVMFGSRMPNKKGTLQNWMRSDVNPYYTGIKVGWTSFKKVMVCPSDENPSEAGLAGMEYKYSYGLNGDSPDTLRGVGFRKVASMKMPSALAVFMDVAVASTFGADKTPTPYRVTYDNTRRIYLYGDALIEEQLIRHNDAPSVLFADGHVAPLENAPLIGGSSAVSSDMRFRHFWYYGIK